MQRSREVTLSNISQMAERGWWMEAMTVWPRPARLLMCSITFSAAKLSSPVRAHSRDQLGEACTYAAALTPWS